MRLCWAKDYRHAPFDRRRRLGARPGAVLGRLSTGVLIP